ncbi:MAG: sensor histidine kinase, partial [Solirubrobacteraceae bacterium]
MRTLARIAIVVAAAVAVSAIAWPVYGLSAALATLEILGPLGAVAASVAELIARHRASVHGLRGQLGLLGALVAAQLGAAVALFAGLMFVSHHDAFFMALAAGYAALVAIAAARLVAGRALDDLDAVRAALSEVGEGARDVRIALRGRDELAALAADVEVMAAKVASAEQARRQLVAAVSHDLRTPLTTLQLIAEGLEDGVFEPDRAREQLRLIGSNVRALGTLIDDLFELSRLEAGDVRWSMQQVRLDELVRETIDAMRPHADAGRVALRAELERELSPAHGNPEALARVFFNLIQNAIRHTPADGSVVISARPAPGPAIEVQVADTGNGIAAGQRERIFEPFVQGPTHVPGEAGSAGLGLAIARAIVEAHGGRIWLAHTVPAGTQIRFSLPTASGPHQPSDRMK